MQDNQKSDEQSFINESDGEKKIYLDVLLKVLIQRCMGRALDEARISSMSDRSLAQFTKTVKDDFYKIINDGRKILKEFSYDITDDSHWGK